VVSTDGNYGCTSRIDKQVWEREMNRLRRISLLLGAALAAVVARIVIDGPELVSGSHRFADPRAPRLLASA